MILALSILAGWTMVARPAARGGPAPTESQVKAAFLLNFAKFVTWPNETFAAPDTPLTIGVVGDDTLAADLEAMIREGTTGARPIAVRRAATWTGLESCHVVFLGSSSDRRFADALTTLHTARTLTVGVADGFARRGGAIQFVREGSRLRFEINVDAARSAELRIGSQLLRLARQIHGSTAPTTP